MVVRQAENVRCSVPAKPERREALFYFAEGLRLAVVEESWARAVQWEGISL
jgi:hypothetical protein